MMHMMGLGPWGWLLLSVVWVALVALAVHGMQALFPGSASAPRSVPRHEEPSAANADDALQGDAEGNLPSSLSE